MMHATDLQSSNQLPPVAKQLLEKAGFKVDLQAMDWQTVVARRAKKEPPDKGGWNVFFTTTVTVDADNPAGNSFTSGDCDKAWFGWPCDPEMEKLRAAYGRENDPEKRKQIALAVSDRVMDQGTYVVLGQYKAFGAYRKDRIDGLARRPGAGVVEHHQEELTPPPGGRERPFRGPAGSRRLGERRFLPAHGGPPVAVLGSPPGGKAMASQSRALRTIPGRACRGGSPPAAHRVPERHDLVEAECVDHCQHVAGDVRERTRGERVGTFAPTVAAHVDTERMNRRGGVGATRIEESRAEPVGVLEQQRRPSPPASSALICSPSCSTTIDRGGVTAAHAT